MPYEACWGTLFLPYETHNRLTPRCSGSKYVRRLLPPCQNDKGDGENVTSSQPPRLLLRAGREGSIQLGEKRGGGGGARRAPRPPAMPPGTARHAAGNALGAAVHGWSGKSCLCSPRSSLHLTASLHDNGTQLSASQPEAGC